ncbi:MAG: DEAD/DEAH box helicase [Thermosipho sp. (in: Bacteria)]|nr:DEAD/DEAH box helicase [Thermosipho sp. (in: thermotogales)]
MIKIIKSNVQFLYNLTEQEKAKIKQDLTLVNPNYYKAKRYSKYNNVNIPKYVFYYRESKDHLVVPSGYKVPFEHEVIEDNRIEVTVPYPKINIKLRATQEEARKAYLDDTDKGMIVLPTGKGKTILAIYLAHNLRQKTLVIVHKDDLVHGWQKDIKFCFGEDFDVGLIKARSRKVGEQITIATIQTLVRLSKEEFEELTKTFGMVIVDECHHIGARVFDLVNEFYANYKLGLSATPERNDGLDRVMNFYLGEIAYQFELKEGETDKDILPVKVLVKNSNIKYRPKVKVVINNKEEELFIDQIPYKQRPRISHHTIDNLVVTNKEYMKMVLDDVVSEYNKGRNLILFFTQKEHCRLYFDSLVNEYKISKEKIQLYYGDATESKAEMKRKAESGEVRITIATYSIATEGTNVKAWEVAFLVSSINNGKNTEQAIGRIRRTKEGKINPVLVYDYRHPYVYSINGHGRTRDMRYRKLNFKVKYLDDNIFVRGFSSRKGLFR